MGHDIQIRIALDTDQLKAIYDLGRMWADEEDDGCFSDEIWTAQIRGKLGLGPGEVLGDMTRVPFRAPYVPVVAFIRDKPIGSIELQINADYMTSKLVGYGDKAYVIPEHRKGHVFAMLVDTARLVFEWFGAATVMIPVGVGGRADFLRQYYEDEGMKISGHLMRIEL